MAPTIDYHVVVERYDVTNQYVPVSNGNVWTHNTTWADLTLGEGRYRATVQTMSCGKFMGPWSETLQFSVEGSSEPAPAEPTSKESPEGTKITAPNGSLTDSNDDVWTFGTQVGPTFYNVMRNGVYMYGAGSQMKYHNHKVYHLGGSGDWYVWDGSGWTDVGPTEP